MFVDRMALGVQPLGSCCLNRKRVSRVACCSSALLQVASLMNHSCQPNVAVRFKVCVCVGGCIYVC